jgi:hypothetical protein
MTCGDPPPLFARDRAASGPDRGGGPDRRPVRAPQAAYTRELLDAIPLPDPDQPWTCAADQNTQRKPAAIASAFWKFSVAISRLL